MRKTIVAGAFASICVLACSIAADAHNSAIDDHFYTFYTFDRSNKTITYFVCGPAGCYSVGTLGKFKSACAILEGTPSTNGNVVTRAIYVLDRGRKPTDQATLVVYTKTDTINDTTGDDIEVTLRAKVQLGFAAGAKAHCSMAANDSFVYVGTDVNGAMRVDKTSLSVGGTSSGNAAAITADERGYITVRDTSGTFIIFDPSGSAQMLGGGIYEMTDTHNAYTEK
jgi:hypothetical protein